MNKRLKKILNKASSSSPPFPIKPMTASRIDVPFDDPSWIFEVKFDGYRIIAFVSDSKVSLLSRGQLDYSTKYLPVTKALSSFKHKIVVDGEIVVSGEDSNPDFNALQNFVPGYPIIYYIFDVLWIDGYNLMNIPLLERREILKVVIPKSDVIKFSEDFPEGVNLFQHIKQIGMEGIVAKRKESLYYPGKRVNTWLKIPIVISEDFVIGGWIDSDSGKLFSSVLFGHYVNGKLIYIHHAGGGFNKWNISELFGKFQNLEIRESPFVNEVKNEDKHKIHWIKPELVAELKLSNKITSSGIIRHPALFVRLRDDKKAADIVKQNPVKDIPVIGTSYDKVVQMNPLETNWKKIEERKITSTGEIEINGKKLTLSNVEREVWKGITKAELFIYYHHTWPFISSYLKDRPLGLHSSPNGANAPSVWLRNMENKQPVWADVYITDRKQKKPGKIDKIYWLVCNNEETLFYIVNLDCIDFHPWASRTTSPDYPDYIIIDLDPGDKDFNKVIETARAAKEIFLHYKLKSFLKTSGKSGIQLYLPCEGISFGDTRAIAENICKEIHNLVPDISTTEVSVKQRGDLLYIDPNQKDYSDRIAAPYCLRAYKQPLVAAPLEWNEVKAGLNPYDFNIQTMQKRLEKKGDLLGGLLNQKNRKNNGRILLNFL